MFCAEWISSDLEATTQSSTTRSGSVVYHTTTRTSQTSFSEENDLAQDSTLIFAALSVCLPRAVSSNQLSITSFTAVQRPYNANRSVSRPQGRFRSEGTAVEFWRWECDADFAVCCLPAYSASITSFLSGLHDTILDHIPLWLSP